MTAPEFTIAVYKLLNKSKLPIESLAFEDSTTLLIEINSKIKFEIKINPTTTII